MSNLRAAVLKELPVIFGYNATFRELRGTNVRKLLDVVP